MGDEETIGMSALLMQAAQSAAQEDGVPPPSFDAVAAAAEARQRPSPGNGGGASTPRSGQLSMPPNTMQPPTNNAVSAAAGGPKKKGPPLRRGKWTPEEEAYANRLIQEFKAGLLPLTDGTTLRTFLSKLLNCDPMRISKKFVGSNCIGKQVFRRRTADLNRLTPEQIHQSRLELSELERRFLERVAQTNRVKSSGVASTAGSTGPAPQAAAAQGKLKDESNSLDSPSPPWLQPPLGYKHGTGAALAAANLSSGGGSANSRAAAAGRALLGNLNSSMDNKGSSNSLTSQQSQLLAMAELQRRASQQGLLQSAFGQGASANNLLAAARQASAARLAGFGNGSSSGSSSVNELMMKTGLSRDQLSQLARERGLSSGSLSNMIQRQSSFDALMSLGFQSLQSIDNLANLIHTGGGGPQLPQSGMKNADFGSSFSRQNLTSSGDLSNAARRLASSGQMDALLRNLSNSNVRGGGGGANANLSNLFQSMQADNGSASSLFGNMGGQSNLSLANLLHHDSSTGLSALRMHEGLNQRNSSVDDFLSLVAAGDIPHQDASLLNIPLMQQQDGGQQDATTAAAAQFLAQQQLLQQATGSHSALANALANALASRSFNSMQSLMGMGSSLSSSTLNDGTTGGSSNALNSGSKRKLDDVGSMDEPDHQKR